MAALRKHDGTVARALELAILTEPRPGEALGVTWAEIDQSDDVWIVPPGAHEERARASRFVESACFVTVRHRTIQSQDFP